MKNLQKYVEIMENTAVVALATSVQDTPNVRFMTIGFNPETKGVIYFPTARGSQKTKEFEINDKVSFTTMPSERGGVLRVMNATVKKSILGVEDIKDWIIKNQPSFAQTAEKIGSLFDVYEVHFQEATVLMGVNENVIVTL